MIRRSVDVINRLGLHARAAAKLVTTASQFQASILVSKDGRAVDGKSIMAVMMLAASCGSVLELTSEGPDEQAAMDALSALINDRFGEEQ